MTVPTKNLMKIKRNSLLNMDEQHLNNRICENIDEKGNDKEDKLTSEENINQQDIEDKTYYEGENIA